MKNNLEIIFFGGGCFWCTEAIFSQLNGVVSVIPGYAGGETTNPDYDRVSSGLTGHAEIIKITFDPQIISFDQLLAVFWSSHDPTTPDRQGNDVGPQYRSIILYTSENQKNTIINSIKKIEQDKLFISPIVTEIKKYSQFYPAESYHQKYYDNNKDQPYCQVIINPKLEKLRNKFRSLVKPL